MLIWWRKNLMILTLWTYDRMSCLFKYSPSMLIWWERKILWSSHMTEWKIRWKFLSSLILVNRKPLGNMNSLIFVNLQLHVCWDLCWVGFLWLHSLLFFLSFSKALEKASKNKAIIEAIGEPIVRGPWYNASLGVAHQRHSVSCTFPVSGPQGSGIFQLKAVRNGSECWFYIFYRFFLSKVISFLCVMLPIPFVPLSVVC